MTSLLLPEILFMLCRKCSRIHAPRSMRRIVFPRIPVGYNLPRLNRHCRRPILRAHAAAPRPTDYAYPVVTVAVGVVEKLNAEIGIMIVDRGGDVMSVGCCLLQRLAIRVWGCAPKTAGAIHGERELGSCAGCASVRSDCPGGGEDVLGVGVGNRGYGRGGDLMKSKSVSFIEQDE